MSTEDARYGRKRMDKYKNFADLSRHESLGKDYMITVSERNSSIAVIAPHGGKIEPATSEIAGAVADDTHSLYLFEGRKLARNGDLHVTSARFDEPRCVKLAAGSSRVVAIHGLSGTTKHVEIGGLDEGLCDTIRDALKDAGFTAEVVTTGELAGRNPNNICNRGRSGAGVQLEISRGLRNLLLKRPQDMTSFAAAIRNAVERDAPKKA
jgi:phage replication-related protein YjqB (UPF0714/DUF867 family)